MREKGDDPIKRQAAVLPEDQRRGCIERALAMEVSEQKTYLKELHIPEWEVDAYCLKRGTPRNGQRKENDFFSMSQEEKLRLPLSVLIHLTTDEVKVRIRSRLVGILGKNGILCVEDLLMKTQDELLQIPSIAQKSVEELLGALADIGFHRTSHKAINARPPPPRPPERKSL